MADQDMPASRAALTAPRMWRSALGRSWIAARSSATAPGSEFVGGFGLVVLEPGREFVSVWRMHDVDSRSGWRDNS